MTSQQFSRRPLRVVVGAVTYPPDVNGAANFGHRLAMGLARQGHDVHVVCHSTDRRSNTSIQDGVTVHRVGSHHALVHPTFRVCPPWRASSAANRLLAEIQPDVVHVQSHFFIGRGLLNAARRMGIALVATNHFMPENMFGYIPVPKVLQKVTARVAWRNLIKHYSKARMVTAPTPRAIQLLRDNGFTNAAMPISCGIDVHRYRPRAEADRQRSREWGEREQDRPRTVLFVGRLDEEKHIDDLLRAMSLVRTPAPTRLEIVGDGSCRESLEQLASELGIAERVHFAGFVDEDELLESYARADLFCMPSIAELQSLATMEAMSARTPVVLANAMALPHLVEPGQNGWLYPPRDVHALANVIDAVVDDPATIERMGAASERIVSKHDIQAVLRQFETIYRSMLATDEESGRSEEVHSGLAS